MKIILCALLIFFISCRGEVYSDNGGRITGGWNAVAKQLPFMAAVTYLDEFLCGGVIIQTKWILTSATCVLDLDVSRIVVKVGGVLNLGSEPSSLQKTVSSVTLHYGFNPGSPNDIYEYNLALLELTSFIMPNEEMRPIKRGTDDVPPGTRLYLAGWGGQSDMGPVSTLQYTDQVTVMDLTECSYDVGISLGINYICTMPYPMHTACHFDEGGPLFSVDPAKEYLLLGIVSYTPCTTLNVPTVYTAIYPRDIQKWINDKTSVIII